MLRSTSTNSSATANIQRRRLAELVACMLLISALGAAVSGWLRQQRLREELVRAMDRVDASAVRRLLREGADPRTRGSNGATTLLWLANDDPAFIEHLIDQGVDVNTPTSNGYTALMRAAGGYGARDHLACVRLLLARGANVDAALTNGRTPLVRAAEDGAPRVVKLLLAHGAATDMRDYKGRTALDLAERWNRIGWKGRSEPHAEIIRLLRQRQASERPMAATPAPLTK